VGIAGILLFVIVLMLGIFLYAILATMGDVGSQALGNEYQRPEVVQIRK
jgi:hypothetical protein